MMQSRSPSGFTLIEAILSLALTALVVGILALATKQFLMTWQTGLASLDDAEELNLTEMAIRRDLDSIAQFSPDHESLIYTFAGRSDSLRIFSEVTKPEIRRPFLAIDFHSVEGKGLIRSSTPYDGANPLVQMNFPKGERLIPSRYSVTFSFRDNDGSEKSDWQSGDLPQMITIEVRGLDQKILAIWPIPLAPRIPAPCARVTSLKDCRDLLKLGRQGSVK
jgi:hypothetical protein